MATASPSPRRAPSPGSPQAPGTVGYNPMRWRRFWLLIVGLLLLHIVVSSIIQAASTPASVTIPYNLFLDEVNAGNVINITATGDSITGTTRSAVSPGGGQPSAKNFSTQRPSYASDNRETALIKNNVKILAEPPNPPTPLWEEILLFFGPTLLIVVGLIYFMRRSAAALGGGAGGILGRFGQSGARLYNAE